jgi:hypothetical protein
MNSSPSLQAIGFVAIPLSAEFADRIRTLRRDDFNRPVSISIAGGGEPLRDQLRRAMPGERIILCGYQSVPLPSPFAEIGPVFISAETAGAAPVWRDQLPVGYFPRTLALRAYDAHDCIIDSTVCEPAAAPDTIRAFLTRPEVETVHARFAGHGCYACRFART